MSCPTKKAATEQFHRQAEFLRQQQAAQAQNILGAAGQATGLGVSGNLGCAAAVTPLRPEVFNEGMNIYGRKWFRVVRDCYHLVLSRGHHISKFESSGRRHRYFEFTGSRKDLDLLREVIEMNVPLVEQD